MPHDWHLNPGRPPRNPETLVDLKLRNGWEVKDRRAGAYRWSLTGQAGDITHFRKGGQ